LVCCNDFLIPGSLSRAIAFSMSGSNAAWLVASIAFADEPHSAIGRQQLERGMAVSRAPRESCC
jgi:hypothetical protein